MRASLGLQSGCVTLFIRLLVILIYTIAIAQITRFHDSQYFEDSRALAYPKSDVQAKDGSADALYNETQDVYSWVLSNLNSLQLNRGRETNGVEDNTDREKVGIAEEINRQLINSAKNKQQTNEGTPEKVVRLLCWVMTDPAILHKTVHVRDTWMQRCDVRLFMSSKEDKKFPTVGLNVSEGRDHIAEKSKAAWAYVYENHRNDAEFFVKADPDSYIVVENLKKYLANCNPDEPAVYGHNLFYQSTVHYVAGAAVVLSRESLTRLVTKGILRPDCYEPGQYEDLKTCLCLQKVGGYVVDTRDEKGREIFLPPFPVETITTGTFPSWYTDTYRKPYGYCQSIDCIGDYPVSFHYVRSEDIYLMDYLLRIHRRHLSTAPDDQPQFRFNGKRYFLQ